MHDREANVMLIHAYTNLAGKHRNITLLYRSCPVFIRKVKQSIRASRTLTKP